MTAVYDLQTQPATGDSDAKFPCASFLSASSYGLHMVALTGFDGGAARTTAEVSIHLRGDNYGIIEDLHQAVVHALVQYMRQSRMTPEAISANVF